MDQHGLFGLAASGKFVSVPGVTVPPDPTKRPGPGPADAYSVLDPFPWNDSTTRAFGWHYATHSRVQVGQNGRGLVLEASRVLRPADATLVPDPYFGAVVNELPAKVRAFAADWLGEGEVMAQQTRLPLHGIYELHGVLFFKVPPTLAFSSLVNLNPAELEECKTRFEGAEDAIVSL